MEAVAFRGGRIRPRVAVVKALASSVCIGTGGSVGREGPIAQIGSTLGSTVGQLLNPRMNEYAILWPAVLLEESQPPSTPRLLDHYLPWKLSSGNSMQHILGLS